MENELAEHESNERDITEYGEKLTFAELTYLWNKISAAGEMKTCIKRFLSEWDSVAASYAITYGHGDSKKIADRVRQLRQSMENYLNCQPPKKNRDKYKRLLGDG